MEKTCPCRVEKSKPLVNTKIPPSPSTRSIPHYRQLPFRSKDTNMSYIDPKITI